MLYFCTLFDSNYLAKGITMANSLSENCNNYHLYIFAFDQMCNTFLEKIHLPNVTIVSLGEFETPELLSVKYSRTPKEYCWTCTPSVILFCLQTYSLDHCTYLDADLFFYSDPGVIYDEMGENDVLITEHRYTPEYDQTLSSGKYCVQYLTVKNTVNGLIILNWWRDACIDWCHSSYDNGRFGDQMYMDDWTTRFTGVQVLQHLGGGIAPWNIQQFSFKKKNKVLIGSEINTGNEFTVIFYHFHAIYSYKKSLLREFLFERYRLSGNALKCLYKGYCRKLIHSFINLQKIDNSFDSLATKNMDYSYFKYAKLIRRRIINRNNNYKYWIYFG